MYDINNFYSYNINKIEDKNDYSIIKINIPNFRELSNKELYILEKDNNKENISNSRYEIYHSIKEKEEIDFQYKIIHNIRINKNKKKNETLSQCESIETCINVYYIFLIFSLG